MAHIQLFESVHYIIHMYGKLHLPQPAGMDHKPAATVKRDGSSKTFSLRLLTKYRELSQSVTLTCMNLLLFLEKHTVSIQVSTGAHPVVHETTILSRVNIKATNTL